MTPIVAVSRLGVALDAVAGPPSDRVDRRVEVDERPQHLVA